MSGGLAVTLNNALSGLNVNQQALTVLSQNIANANTPGYSKENINLKAVYLEGQGSGVTIQDVTRKVDQYLQSSVTNQTSTTGLTGVLNSYANNVQLLLGQPGSDNDITSAVNGFFNSLQSLASSPQDVTQQSLVINSAVTLSSQMNQLASGLQNLRLQADTDINTAVSAINTDLQQLHDLNGAIATATVQGQSTAGLEDSWDSTINDLAQYMNIQTSEGSNGATNVYTSGGTALVDENLHQLNYTPAGSVQSFINNTTLSPLTVTTLDTKGNTIGTPAVLVSGGPSSQVNSTLVNGQLAALVQERDTDIPNMLSQVDNFAASLRNQVNAISNSGSGYPGSTSLNGTKLVSPSSVTQWTGAVRIAVLDNSGQPVASPYAGQTGLTPLTLDLSSLNTGSGAGNPSVQGIINAINQYYSPQNKATVGNLDNIQLASNSASIPDASGQFNFNFNLSNLSSTNSSFFVTGVNVTDDQGNTVSAPTLNPPSISVASYDTAANSNLVNVNVTGGTAGLKVGQQVYLSNPGTSIGGGGISASDVTGVFTIAAVTANGFQIQAADSATTTGNTVVAAPTSITVPSATVGANSATLSGSNMNINLASDPTAAYYTVSANVVVNDGNGNTSTSTVTYRIYNGQSNTLNSVYGAQTADGDGTIVAPTSTTPIVRASLVDANGNQLPTINGQYDPTVQGYLQITSTNSNDVIAIDSLTSADQGQPNSKPPVAATGQGFSSFFDLNDFFVQPNSTSNTNSALNLTVQQRIVNSPNLMSMGNLTQSTTNANLYERDIGDGSVSTQLANLASASVNFGAAGGLAASTGTLTDYASQIIGAAASSASTASSNDTNAQSLLTGYQQQSSAVSGVNLNTELANTIIYQNAYAASARVITVTNSLFTTLLQTFQ